LKKWIITILAVLGLLSLAVTARLWVPWLLGFATQNKERVDALKGFVELVSKLVAGTAAVLLPLYKLWRERKEPVGEATATNHRSGNQPARSACSCARSRTESPSSTSVASCGFHWA
jgi:hypothetical protein